MKVRKVVVAFMVLSVVSMPQAMASIGLGVSLTGDGQAIYFPIKANNGLLIEPYISYSSFNNDNEWHEIDNKDQAVGIGVMKSVANQQPLQFYYGIRLAAIKGEDKFQDIYHRIKSKTKTTGYSLAPTIGFEYPIMDNFSLSGEASYYFSKEKHVMTETYNSYGNSFSRESTSRSRSTETKLIFRYMFN